MDSLSFYDAEEFKSQKSHTRECVDAIIEMPKDKAVEVTGNPTRLKSLKSILYNEHKGKFRIYDHYNKIIIKWKQ